MPILAVIGVILMFAGAIYEHDARWGDEKGLYVFALGLFMLLFSLE